MTRHTLFAALLLMLAARFGMAASEQGYRTEGDCDGLPRTTLTVEKPYCVGLVAEHLGFVRGVTALGNDIFLTDMGGWGSRRGRLLRLSPGNSKPQVVLARLEGASTVLPAPGTTLYLALKGRIIQLNPYATDPAATVREIVTGLPANGRHPLTVFTVAPDGSLFINVGSATNNCEGPDGTPPDPTAPCPETLESPPRGSILHVTPATTAIDARTLTPYARGLRNSMALAMLPGGQLAAAVNARDAISLRDPALPDASLPHDTLVLVKKGQDYGWPYCFDLQRPSPDYPNADCRRTQPPALLLPAHSAPLGMLVYQGKKLAGLTGQLLIAYHGYRSTGHRLVAVRLPPQGRPDGTPRNIISDWGYLAGQHPQGAPVSLFELPDGSVLISEDRNGSLLRLSAPRPAR